MQGENVRVFTEEELLRLLDRGEAPAWYVAVESQAAPAGDRRKRSHHDLIDLDHLTKEYVIREIVSLFGGRRIPKKRQAEVTYKILEFAKILGLVAEQDAISEMRSLVSTERLVKYWPKFFGGEKLSAISGTDAH